MSSKLYIIGIPLTEDSISQEFKVFFESNLTTLIITTLRLSKLDFIDNDNEYSTCKVGFDYIIQKKFNFIPLNNGFLIEKDKLQKYIDNTLRVKSERDILLANLWGSLQGRRYDWEVADLLIETVNYYIKKNVYDRICIVGPGSLRYADSRMNFFLHNYKDDYTLIDAKSSLQLSIEELEKIRPGIKNYPIKVYDGLEVDLKENYINVHSCLTPLYKKDISKLIGKLNDSFSVYIIKLGSTTIIDQLNAHELKSILLSKSGRDDLKDKTVIVIPNCLNF